MNDAAKDTVINPVIVGTSSEPIQSSPTEVSLYDRPVSEAPPASGISSIRNHVRQITDAVENDPAIRISTILGPNFRILSLFSRVISDPLLARRTDARYGTVHFIEQAALSSLKSANHQDVNENAKVNRSVFVSSKKVDAHIFLELLHTDWARYSRANPSVKTTVIGRLLDSIPPSDASANLLHGLHELAARHKDGKFASRKSFMAEYDSFNEQNSSVLKSEAVSTLFIPIKNRIDVVRDQDALLAYLMEEIAKMQRNSNQDTSHLLANMQEFLAHLDTEARSASDKEHASTLADMASHLRKIISSGHEKSADVPRELRTLIESLSLQLKLFGERWPAITINCGQDLNSLLGARQYLGSFVSGLRKIDESVYSLLHVSNPIRRMIYFSDEAKYLQVLKSKILEGEHEKAWQDFFAIKSHLPEVIDKISQDFGDVKTGRELKQLRELHDDPEGWAREVSKQLTGMLSSANRMTLAQQVQDEVNRIVTQRIAALSTVANRTAQLMARRLEKFMAYVEARNQRQYQHTKHMIDRSYSQKLNEPTRLAARIMKEAEYLNAQLDGDWELLLARHGKDISYLMDKLEMLLYHEEKLADAMNLPEVTRTARMIDGLNSEMRTGLSQIQSLVSMPSPSGGFLPGMDEESVFAQASKVMGPLLGKADAVGVLQLDIDYHYENPDIADGQMRINRHLEALRKEAMGLLGHIKKEPACRFVDWRTVNETIANESMAQNKGMREVTPNAPRSMAPINSSHGPVSEIGANQEAISKSASGVNLDMGGRNE